MSTNSNTPVIVVERHELDVRSDEEEGDDDVFVNPTALYRDGRNPTDQAMLTPPRFQSPVGCLHQSPGFLKFSSTVQFVRTWAGRVARPLDHRESAASMTNVRPSRLFIKTGVSPKTQLEKRVPEKYVPLLKRIKHRLIWNPNGNWLYL